MNESKTDGFGSRGTFSTAAGPVGIYRLAKLEELGLGNIFRLPYSIRVLLESVLRNCDGFEIVEEDVKNLAGWNASAPAKVEIPFQRSWIWLPCVAPCTAWAEIQRKSIR